MKTVLLVLSSFIFLFASTPQERESKVQSVVDMQVTNTAIIEKRIAKIHAALEQKAKERLGKEKIREAKLKQLDDRLQAQAVAREKASK